MPEEQLEIVRQLFDAFNRGDLQGQLRHLADDYEWYPAFTGGGLLEGNVYCGRGGYRRYWQGLAETWSEIDLTLDELRDLGGSVLVLATIHALGRGSGVEVDQSFGGIWTFRDGRLVEGRAYRTWDEALRAAGKRS